MKKVLFGILLFFIVFEVSAKSYDGYLKTNVIIDNKSIIELTDNDCKTKYFIKANTPIEIESIDNFNYVYIIYYFESSKGLLTSQNYSKPIGQNNFLHELVKLNKKLDKATISFDNDVYIKEIYTFSDSLPNWVQDWNEPLEKADVLLFSTHSDDEQLYFAGLVPTMVNMDKKMQVVYYTKHYNNPERFNELLNGLWTSGLRYYPIMSEFPDAYSNTLDNAIKNLESSGYKVEDAVEFQKEMIRRFKPDIIFGHDINGEYGHGQHRLNTYTLKKAISELSFKEQPQKVYLHLYDENKITMNYDIPLDNFNGKTAYEVAKIAFLEHESQQSTRFPAWLNGEKNEYTKATDIKTYSPLEFGLYYSKVGYENVDNDIFYNIKREVSYKWSFTIPFIILILITCAIIIVEHDKREN